VVARLTASGALDSTFGPNGQGYNYLSVNPAGPVNTDSVNALGLDPSGNILVGGSELNSAGNARPDQVVRYTASGLLDSSFANAGVLDFPFSSPWGVDGIAFQSSGQIILGLAAYNGAGTGGVARLNTNGTVDTSFGSSGYFSDPHEGGAVEIAVQPDDKILLESLITNSSGNTYGTLVDRLLAGGSLDSAFGTGGQVVIGPTNAGIPEGIVVGPDGKITGSGRTGSGAIDTFRLLNDITSNMPTAVAAPSTPSVSPTAITAMTPDLLGSALDSADLWSASGSWKHRRR
jgi:uncharacterized delta-60 repeat protein